MEVTIQKNIPAKLNLSLSITGKRGSLHTIESVMISVNLYDTVTANSNGGKGINLSLKSDNSDFVDSLYRKNINRAIDKFVSRYGSVDADLKVHNRIKLGAGIGGSTSGIIGVLKCLAELKNVELDIAFLLSVGSDAPFMATGGTCFVFGVGESVRRLEYKKLHFVVLLSPHGVDSSQAYRLYDELKEEKRKKEAVRSADMLMSLYGHPFENDLEIPAIILNAEIETAKKSLYQAGAKNVLMSGSGSAVFGVFEDADDAKTVFEKVEFVGEKLLLCSVEA